jgi:hypothetical protein
MQGGLTGRHGSYAASLSVIPRPVTSWRSAHSREQVLCQFLKGLKMKGKYDCTKAAEGLSISK